MINDVTQIEMKVYHGIENYIILIVSNYLFFLKKIFYSNKICYQQLIENEFYVVKEYKFCNPLTPEIDSIKDNCFRDCHSSYFHNFKYDYIYDIKLTSINNNETFNLIISGKSISLYELKKKLKVAKQNGFIFNQINKLAKKFCSHLRYIHISYYLKSQIPMCHRHFSRVISLKSRIYKKILH